MSVWKSCRSACLASRRHGRGAMGAALRCKGRKTSSLRRHATRALQRWKSRFVPLAIEICGAADRSRLTQSLQVGSLLSSAIRHALVPPTSTWNSGNEVWSSSNEVRLPTEVRSQTVPGVCPRPARCCQ